MVLYIKHHITVLLTIGEGHCYFTSWKEMPMNNWLEELRRLNRNLGALVALGRSIDTDELRQAVEVMTDLRTIAAATLGWRVVKERKAERGGAGDE